MRERVMSRAMHLDALFQRIEVLPGVESAAGATAVPFVGTCPGRGSGLWEACRIRHRRFTIRG